MVAAIADDRDILCLLIWQEIPHFSEHRGPHLIVHYRLFQFGELSSGHRTATGKGPLDHRKRSVFIPIPKKGNAKECSNYHTIALISHASKVMLKVLQVSLQQYMDRELPDVQADFRKGRGTRDQIANIH